MPSFTDLEPTFLGSSHHWTYAGTRGSLEVPYKPNWCSRSVGPLEPIPKASTFVRLTRKPRNLISVVKCVSTQFRVIKAIDQKWLT